MRFVGAIGVVISVCFVVSNACESGDHATRPDEFNGDADVDARPLSTYVDTDDDGLCDISEENMGTDPKKADSDSDGYPDLVEVINGFDAIDPRSPTADQVVFLTEEAGSTADVTASVLVDGNGEQYTGAFEPLDVLTGEELTVADFFNGLTALSATPPDNALGLDAKSGRFTAVQGRTLLTFSIHFAFTDQRLSDVIHGYPFNFFVKSPDDEQIGTEQYLLVTLPLDSDIKKGTWYRPDPCL
jgi:hypothetical protein